MSANSGPIQTLPRGLLALLGLKNLGKLPDVLVGSVQPQFNIAEFWMQNLATFDLDAHTVTLTNGQSGFAGYSTGPLVVPQNETWWVDVYSVNLILPAGAGEVVHNWQPGYQLNVSPNIVVGLCQNGQTHQGLAAGINYSYSAVRNFWLPPGATLGVLVGEVATAGAPAAWGTLRAVRLQV